jgi:hypothetical protein
VDWYDRRFKALLMDASEGTSGGVRLMDDLKESRLCRWTGTGSICLAVNWICMLVYVYAREAENLSAL